jgi:antitoxin YefM
MDAISYTTAAQNLAQTMDRVCDDHETIIITREAQQSVVLMSLDEYNSLEATMHLLRSPKNAERLMASIAQLEAGHGTERELFSIRHS